MKSLTFKKTFKSFTRAVSPFFKVNSSPNETITLLDSESVIGVCVGVTEVDGGSVGGSVRAGEGVVRWLKTKYPASPAITAIPIMTRI